MLRFKFLYVCLIALSGFFLYACTSQSADPLADIKREKEVKIVTFPVNEPFSFGQATGVQGLDVDIGEEIANTLGVKPRWIKAATFASMFDLVKNGEVQMAISSISITPEREKEGFVFSQPYYDSWQTVAKSKGNKAIKSFEDLKGKKVGVHEGTTAQKFVEKNALPGMKIEKYRSLEDALQAANAKEIDAVVGDYPIISYNIYKTYHQLETLDQHLTDEKYGVLLKQQPNNELLNIVNRTLDRLKENDKYSELQKKWFGEYLAAKDKERQEKNRAEQLHRQPKTVVFRISRDPSYKEFPMENLDGFQIILHSPDSGKTYTSSHIITQGNSGQSQLSALPGKYTLNLKRIGLSVPNVVIPADDSKSVTVNIRLSRTGASINVVRGA